MAKPIVLDGASLAPADADDLKRLVAATDFFNLPPQLGAPKSGAADMRTKTVTVDDGTRTHVVSALDTDVPPALKELIDFVTKRGGRGP